MVGFFETLTRFMPSAISVVRRMKSSSAIAAAAIPIFQGVRQDGSIAVQVPNSLRDFKALAPSNLLCPRDGVLFPFRLFSWRGKLSEVALDCGGSGSGRFLWNCRALAEGEGGGACQTAAAGHLGLSVAAAGYAGLGWRGHSGAGVDVVRWAARMAGVNPAARKAGGRMG